MNKPTKDDAVSGIRSMIPNLVQWPSHFAGRSENADVWLRKSKDESEIDAIAIEVPAAPSPQTDAILGKFSQIAHVPKATLDTAVRDARTTDKLQPSHREAIPGGILTVTRHPNTIAIRTDYE
jgi:hypothetical protein